MMYFNLYIFLMCYFLQNTCLMATTLEERDAVMWARSDYENDTSVRNASITWSDEDIADLKFRLNNTRNLIPPFNDAGFTYGFNTKTLKNWTDYWINKYNFTERAALLNKYPLKVTNIQGLDIFFIHVKAEVNGSCPVLPLLMLHGFPGSIIEFQKAIPILTAGCVNGIAFELIIPCLPGFGYSDAATQPGLGSTEMGTVFKNLMLRLGFDAFYLQGGDLGSAIGTMMATLYPKIILGFHTNFPVSFSPLSIAVWFAGSLNTSLVVSDSLKGRMYPVLTVLKQIVSLTGYFHIQATKPDTLGVAMSDSPAALLAYILMLFSGSRPNNIYQEDGGLDNGLYSRDELIDNLMLYWIPNKFGTAARMYAESYNSKVIEEGLLSVPTTVPTWTVHALYEMLYQTQGILKFKFQTILNSTVFDDYGHFLALEQPEIYSDSVFTAMAAFKNYNEERNYYKTEL